MKLLSKEEVDVVDFKPQMTRKEKLIRWANLVRCSRTHLHIYHGLEYMNPRELRSCSLVGAASAFTVAMADPIFNAQGLKPDAKMGDVMDFFSLSQHQLHEFCCDCGGPIHKADMADRIDRLAR